MAINGIITFGSMQLDHRIPVGGAALTMVMRIVDDQFGVIGERRKEVTDPERIAQVRQFVELLLPELSAEEGFPVEMEPAPTPTPTLPGMPSVSPLPPAPPVEGPAQPWPTDSTT